MDMEFFKRRDSYEGLALWKRRRNELELLFLTKMEDLKQPGDLAKHLKKLKIAMQAEKNVFNSTLAIKYLTSLFNDSRIFTPHGSAFFSILLEKFKEKKPELKKAVHEALSAFFRNPTLDVTLLESIKTALKSENPLVKVETLRFVIFAFEQHKKIYLQVMPSLLKLATDRDCKVRNASIKAIASAVEIYGDCAIQLIQRGDVKSKDYHSKQCSTFKAFQAAHQISSFYFVKF